MPLAFSHTWTRSERHQRRQDLTHRLRSLRHRRLGEQPHHHHRERKGDVPPMATEKVASPLVLRASRYRLKVAASLALMKTMKGINHFKLGIRLQKIAAVSDQTRII